MNSRERLLTVLKGELPDHVPAAPDTSNMIPAALTGRPFWDLYLYQDPPIWKAYIDCVKHFGFDSLMDGYVSILFEELGEIDRDLREAIIDQSEDRIITQRYKTANGTYFWQDRITIYYRDNPPTDGLSTRALGLSLEPARFRPVEGVREWPQGEALLKLVKDEMGQHGLVGVWCGTSKLLHSENDIYDFYDNPEKYYERRDRYLETCEQRFNKLMSLETKPDFICTGGSGTLIHQNLDTFRQLALPIVQKVTRMAKEVHMPTHIHSCGPEKELVKIFAEETNLTIVDPLEIPPMGDCNLKELKDAYGDKLILKGNLHTSNVMLMGTTADVEQACRQAIDDAAQGGRFILSTGDQCGRDTPHENIYAMIETAKSYGRYSR